MLRSCIAFAVALTLVGCGSQSKGKTDQDVVDEVTAATQKAFSAWDPKPLNDHYTQGTGRDKARDDDAKAMKDAQSKFGALTSLGKGELRIRDGSDTSYLPESTPIVRFSEAKFEKGSATVEVWIRANKQTYAWTIDHYKIVPKSS